MPGLNELLDDGAGPVAGIVVHNHNFIGQFTVVLMKRAPASNSARSSHRLYVHTSMEISMWSPTCSSRARWVLTIPEPSDTFESHRRHRCNMFRPPRQGEA